MLLRLYGVHRDKRLFLNGNYRGLEYIRIIYGEAAQKFIVKNMDQIINAKYSEPVNLDTNK